MRISPGLRQWRQTAAWCLLTGLLLCPSRARAVPSFAEQTGQPCAACHVGAFGPQLTKFGRDFKLNGYVASDGKKHGLPLAVTTQLSFTHTNNDQPGPAAPDSPRTIISRWIRHPCYYAGRIAWHVGGFIQVTYDGVARQLHIDNADVRYAHTANCSAKTWSMIHRQQQSYVTDLWNSTPVWGFPYNQSPLAPMPMAATLIDGGLGQRVSGAGAYTMWNGLVYAEFDLYRGLGYDVLNATGIVPVADTDKTQGVIPYWRLALRRISAVTTFEVGTYGLNGNVARRHRNSRSRQSIRRSRAGHQLPVRVNPSDVTSDMVSAHATLIHEDGWLGASRIISGSLPFMA